MTLYSKNGSIPYPTKDETEGWIEVEDAPVAPEGKEVVWWYPPGWVVRDPMPVKDGFTYSWNQSEGVWAEQAIVTQQVQVLETTQIQSLTTAQVQALGTEQVQVLSTTQISALG
jgi:hypothetical protein